MSATPCRSRRTCRRHRPNGFTLIEVMVALVVMSVLAVMTWQGVDGIVRARDASSARLERTLRLGTVLMQWDQDIAALQTTTRVPKDFAFDGGSVRLVRRAEGGLQVVVWSLRPGLDTNVPGSTLVRWVGPTVTTSSELNDSWLRSLQLQGTETGSVRTVNGLAEWQIYCYRGAWTNCQSSSGSAAGATVADDAVRMVLTFAAGSGVDGQLTRDTVMAKRW